MLSICVESKKKTCFPFRFKTKAVLRLVFGFDSKRKRFQALFAVSISVEESFKSEMSNSRPWKWKTRAVCKIDDKQSDFLLFSLLNQILVTDCRYFLYFFFIRTNHSTSNFVNSFICQCHGFRKLWIRYVSQ